MTTSRDKRVEQQEAFTLYLEVFKMINFLPVVTGSAVGLSVYAVSSRSYQKKVLKEYNKVKGTIAEPDFWHKMNKAPKSARRLAFKALRKEAGI